MCIRDRHYTVSLQTVVRKCAWNILHAVGYAVGISTSCGSAADAGHGVEEEGTHVQQGVNEAAEVDAEAPVAARGSDDMSEDTGRGVEEEGTHVEECRQSRWRPSAVDMRDVLKFGGGARSPLNSGEMPTDVAKNTLTPATCLLYTSPSPRDATLSRMPSSA